MKKYEFTHTSISSAWGPWDRNDGGFIISWGCKNVGFGELTFSIKNGETHCDSETMSREFIKQALEHLVESVNIK